MSILSLPWRPGPGGFFARETNRRAVVESRIFQIMFQNPHERFMRNDLGVPMMDWIWEPVDDIFEAMVETHSRPMIQHWIKDIQVVFLTVTREEIESDTHLDTLVRIGVHWRDLLSDAQVESDFQHTFRRSRQ